MDNTSKNRNGHSRKSIYVVGFPKSGNTWLVRMLSDVLQCFVCPTVQVQGGVEIASEINQQISMSSDTGYDIAKAHSLPQRFFKYVKDSPVRIVYMYRDFRDLNVSGFFYFKFNGDENLVRMSSFSSLISNGPKKVLRYFNNRVSLLNYVKSLCIGGFDGLERTAGTWNWSQHIREWLNVSSIRPDVNIVFVSYEELLDDTRATILRIIRKLNLPEPNNERLQCAIENQSFTKLKEHFQNLPNNAAIPFGKDFNIRFLRKGISGDWKNFLSCQMAEMIQEHHGDMLFELGYESDPFWYKKAKNCKAEIIFRKIRDMSRRLKLRDYYRLVRRSFHLIFHFKKANIRRLTKFYRSYKKYKALSESEKLSVSDWYPCINDSTTTTPFDAHYFYQGVWAFDKIKESGVESHVDVGSEIRWIGLLSTITKVTFIDIRPLKTELKNLTVKKGNILNMPFEDESVDSLSSLHVAEHIGLGRYGDRLDPDGTKKACKELSRILAPNGSLYFSVPVGKQKTYFNSHRVHSAQTVIDYFKDLNLIELSGVTDGGKFSKNIDINILEKSEYACGLFWFQKDRE